MESTDMEQTHVESWRTMEVEPIYQELAEQIEGEPRWAIPRLLKLMIPMEEAGIVRELPAPAEVVAETLSLPIGQVEETQKRLLRKGVCTKNKNGHLRLIWTLFQLADLGWINPEFDEEYGEEFFGMLEFFKRNPDFVRYYNGVIRPEGVRTQTFRVVPRWRAIKDIPGVMPCEDLREILKQHDGRISTVRCICRLTTNDRFCAVNEGTRPEEGHCIKLGRIAEHQVEQMGIGSYLSWEEALKLHDETDKSPIYTQVGNSREVSGAYCNCCACCCLFMDTGEWREETLKDAIAPSRFLCLVDKKKCNGCEICIKKCPFSAMRMTQSGERVIIKASQCTGCGNCVLNCPESALKLKLVRPPEHIPDAGASDDAEFLGY